MWTPAALASKHRELAGTIWRAVEHQYTTSTRRIVDTLQEQEQLEAILEGSKPPYPPESEHLHYLLKTPFRYAPSNQFASRFRRPHDPGVFYAAEHARTALAEMAYHRRRFFAASPATPLPQNEQRLTLFSAAYGASRGIDLTATPLNRDRPLWTDPHNYGATQALAAAARSADIGAIRYESVRDPAKAANVALLTPASFASPSPLSQQTWLMYLAPAETSCRRAGEDAETWVFRA